MRICVYCSSSSMVARVYQDAARDMGALLAQRGHTLIYGGGNVGLMGLLAKAAHAGGGRVIGVIPSALIEYGVANEQVDELIVTDTMAERKTRMERESDAFVALPGGFGTLEELTQAITLKQLQYLDAPIALVNTAGFYEPLLAVFAHFYTQRFAHQAYQGLYEVVADPLAALEYVERYIPGEPRLKWVGKELRAES